MLRVFTSTSATVRPAPNMLTDCLGKTLCIASYDWSAAEYYSCGALCIDHVRLQYNARHFACNIPAKTGQSWWLRIQSSAKRIM